MDFKENLERILKKYREKKEHGKNEIEGYPIASNYSPYVFNKLNEYLNTAKNYFADYYKRRKFQPGCSYS